MTWTRNVAAAVLSTSVCLLSNLAPVGSVASAAELGSAVSGPEHDRWDESDADLIAAAIEFRDDLHFNADESFVRALLGGAEGSIYNRFGMPFTRDEVLELDARDLSAWEVVAALRPGHSLVGRDFGGIYLDNQTGKVVVLTTGDTAGLYEAVASGMTFPARLQVSRVTNSWRDLTDVVARIADDTVQTGEISGVAVSAIKPDATTNSVIVTTPGTEAEARILEQYYAGYPVVVSRASASTTSKLGVTNAPPLRGGQDIRDTYGYRCTSGFVGFTPTTQLGAPVRNYFLLTAGHCGGGRTGTVFTQVAHPIGRSAANSYSTPSFVDGNAIEMPAAEASDEVYETRTASGTNIYQVISYVEQEGDATDMVGQPVCQAGVTSNFVCGTIVSKGFVANYPADPAAGLDHSQQIRGLRETSQRARGGDSGGSVYSGGLAKGIVSGEVTTYNADGTVNDRNGLYGHVRDVTGVKRLSTTGNS